MEMSQPGVFVLMKFFLSAHLKMNKLNFEECKPNDFCELIQKMENTTTPSGLTWAGVRAGDNCLKDKGWHIFTQKDSGLWIKAVVTLHVHFETLVGWFLLFRYFIFMLLKSCFLLQYLLLKDSPVRGQLIVSSAWMLILREFCLS